MLVEPRALVRRLTPTATRLLEASVGTRRQLPRIRDRRRAPALDDARGRARATQRASSTSTAWTGTGSSPTWSACSPACAPGTPGGRCSPRASSSGSRTPGWWPRWTGAPCGSGPASCSRSSCSGPGATPRRPTRSWRRSRKEELRSSLEDALAPGVETEESAPRPAAAGSAAAAAPGRRAARPRRCSKFATNFTERARDGQDRPHLRPRPRDPADHRHPRPAPEEQPHHRGRAGRRQDRAGRGAGPGDRRGRRPGLAPERSSSTASTSACSRPAPGVKGEFENRLKAVIDEVKASPMPIILFIDEAHTLIGAGGAAGRRRRGQPPQAGARPRRAAHHRRHHLERVQEVLREGRRARAPLPAGQGRRAGRGGRRSPCSAACAPLYEKAHGVTIRDEAVVAAVQLSPPLHLRPAAPGQGGRPARHRDAPG